MEMYQQRRVPSLLRFVVQGLVIDQKQLENKLEFRFTVHGTWP